MRRYFGRKLFIYLLTFWVAATIDWMIPRFMPGDPIQSLLSRTQVAPEAVADLIAYYKNLFGLDVPLWQQYLNFWARLLQGDLGRSVYLGGRPVTDVIMAALPYTLALLIPAVLLSWWTGNKAGALAARRQRARQHAPPGELRPHRDALHVARDHAGLDLRLGPGDLPDLGRLLATAWSRRSPGPSSGPAWHWFLPFMSLFLVMFGGWAIGMRNMIIYELDADYARYLGGARRPSGLVRRYAFRNAVLPQVTGLALTLGVIVAGALVTEIVFSYPGIGKLLLAAVQNQDYFLLQGIFLFIIVGVLVANFIVDIAYVLIDPRTRVGMSGGTA